MRAAGIDRRAAFRAQRADVLAYCAALGPADWRMDSRAAGWSVTDVIGHMAAGCHAMFTPAVFRIIRATDIEQANDAMVDIRRGRTPAGVLGEYRRWSGVFGNTIPLMVRTPMASVKLPLAELGTFPMQVLPSALIFDHHTHLHHDVAPVLDHPLPPTDANRMAAVLEWMMAVLANQLRTAKPAWLDRPVSMTLVGPGGGSWRVDPSGAVTACSPESSAAARITAAATEFPEWGTRRADWRDRDVRVQGDTDYASVLLDWMNIV